MENQGVDFDRATRIMRLEKPQQIALGETVTATIIRTEIANVADSAQTLLKTVVVLFERPNGISLMLACNFACIGAHSGPILPTALVWKPLKLLNLRC